MEISFSNINDVDFEYSLGHFKTHGTPYIRLKVPESQNEQWTCFTEDTYQNIIYLKMDEPIKDSLLTNCNNQVILYQKEISDYQQQLFLKNQNETELEKVTDGILVKYKVCNVKLYNEEPKKWKWGLLGFLSGSLVGIISTLYLIH